MPGVEVSQIVCEVWPCCSTLEVKITFQMVSKDQAKSRTDSLAAATNMFSYMAPRTMETFKIRLNFGRIACSISLVVNLKLSIWSEEIQCTVFPANILWSSWAAPAEPHSHRIGRLLHFYEQSGNFLWRDYWKTMVYCWGFLSFGTETVHIAMYRITVNLWETTSFLSVR